MKNYITHNLPILAVLASFALIPVNTAAAGVAFTFTGVIAMLFADYGRNIIPVSANAGAFAFRSARSETAPLAA
jgi:hypothetical protein